MRKKVRPYCNDWAIVDAAAIFLVLHKNDVKDDVNLPAHALFSSKRKDNIRHRISYQNAIPYHERIDVYQTIKIDKNVTEDTIKV